MRMHERDEQKNRREWKSCGLEVDSKWHSIQHAVTGDVFREGESQIEYWMPRQI